MQYSILRGITLDENASIIIIIKKVPYLFSWAIKILYIIDKYRGRTYLLLLLLYIQWKSAHNTPSNLYHCNLNDIPTLRFSIMCTERWPWVCGGGEREDSWTHSSIRRAVGPGTCYIPAHYHLYIIIIAFRCTPLL